VPSARPTVLDSASSAAPRSPCSSVGGAAASRSQEPLATPRGLFWLWCDGIAASRVYRAFGGPARCLTGRRCDGVSGTTSGSSAVGRGGLKGRERAVQALRPQFKSPGARAQPCAARASGAGSCSPQNSIRPAGGLRDEGTSTATRTSPAREFLTLAFPFSRARARGRGIPGALGARDSSSGGLVFAGGRAAIVRTDRARPPSGGGRAHSTTNTTTPLGPPS